MGVQKITFEGSNVTSKIDSDLYHFMFSNDVGILKGLKEECKYSLASNTITFKDGYVSIYGRIIYIEDQTSISILTDSEKYGFVVLGVDTSTNEVSLYLKEQSSSYPILTKTNFLTTQGLYEFAICTYSKTTTSILLNPENTRSMIENDKQRILELENQIRIKRLPYRQDLIKISNGIYQFDRTSSDELSESIIYVTINNSVVITFPGEAMFLFVGSNTSIAYRYGGSDYSLSVIYEDERVTLTAGNTMHNITSVFIKK